MWFFFKRFCDSWFLFAKVHRHIISFIVENMPVGAEVIIVQAADLDSSSSSIKYSIIGGDGIGFFFIDQKGFYFLNRFSELTRKYEKTAKN